MAKYLDKSGVQSLWAKVKSYVNSAVSTGVTDKIGQANGVAGLDSNGKLPANQLTELKTINGESIVGSGNITIDLGIYQLVESLPESNQNPNKIYLVTTSGGGGEQNVYTEFIWVNNAWETLGEYKADIDLAPYLKIEKLSEEAKKVGLISEDSPLVGGIEYSDIQTLNSEGQHYMNILKNISIAEEDQGDGKKIYLKCKGYGYREYDGQKYNSTSKINYIELPDATSSKRGVMLPTQYSKLEAIEAQATKDEAITSEELDAILV